MRVSALALSTLLWTGFAVAEGDMPVAEDLDGPWTLLPADADIEALMAPLTPEDIVRMADLDGDPTVLTDDEAEMIRVLGAVLLGVPVEE
ncbi:hypothetical protein AAD018_007055 [Aestuariibius insulae]|uniref:hypothetical protein n=1 Tax=Aestuariibius insulae TaxID=2058287 RepID=UPI00345E96D8